MKYHKYLIIIYFITLICPQKSIPQDNKKNISGINIYSNSTTMIDSSGNNIMEEWNNLNSSAKIIKNDSLLLDTLKRNRTLEFNAGILIPLSNSLDRLYNTGFAFSIDMHIPFNYIFLKHTLSSQISFDIFSLNGETNFKNKSIIFKNSVSLKNTPLILKFGSGFSRNKHDYFINSIDLSYKLPFKKLEILFNVNFKGFLKSFEYINKTMGLNINFSKTFKKTISIN